MGEPTDAARRFYEAFNNGDLDAAVSGFSQDCKSYGPMQGWIEGRVEFREHLEVFKRAIPNATVTPSRFVEDGGTVAVEGSFRGTHSGVFTSPQGDVPATGRSITLGFADFITVNEGEVVEHRAYFDLMDLINQLGIMDGA